MSSAPVQIPTLTLRFSLMLSCSRCKAALAVIFSKLTYGNLEQKVDNESTFTRWDMLSSAGTCDLRRKSNDLTLLQDTFLTNQSREF